MNKQVVLNILKNIFSAYGYKVDASKLADIVASKDSDQIYIKYDLDLNYNSVEHFSDSIKSLGKGLVISDEIPENVRRFAFEKDLMVWDRGELEVQIGRAVLASSEGQVAQKPGLEQRLFVSAQPAAQQSREEDVKIRILLPSLPINLSKTNALAIAESQVGSPKSQKLKFMPLWRYKYSFNAQKRFRSKIVDLSGNGEGGINALTGDNNFTSYKEIRNNVEVPTQNYEIKEPAVQKKDAFSRAITAIIQEHAKEMRLNEMIGDTIVFEHRVFAPEASDINATMELVYLPVWEIKGAKDVIEINAYDGHILGIQTYHDAEFV